MVKMISRISYVFNRISRSDRRSSGPWSDHPVNGPSNETMANHACIASFNHAFTLSFTLIYTVRCIFWVFEGYADWAWREKRHFTLTLKRWDRQKKDKEWKTCRIIFQQREQQVPQVAIRDVGISRENETRALERNTVECQWPAAAGWRRVDLQSVRLNRPPIECGYHGGSGRFCWLFCCCFFFFIPFFLWLLFSGKEIKDYTFPRKKEMRICFALLEQNQKSDRWFNGALVKDLAKLQGCQYDYQVQSFRLEPTLRSPLTWKKWIDIPLDPN